MTGMDWKMRNQNCGSGNVSTIVGRMVTLRSHQVIRNPGCSRLLGHAVMSDCELCANVHKQQYNNSSVILDRWLVKKTKSKSLINLYFYSTFLEYGVRWLQLLYFSCWKYEGIFYVNVITKYNLD